MQGKSISKETFCVKSNQGSTTTRQGLPEKVEQEEEETKVHSFFGRNTFYAKDSTLFVFL